MRLLNVKKHHCVKETAYEYALLIRTFRDQRGGSVLWYLTDIAVGLAIKPA